MSQKLISYVGKLETISGGAGFTEFGIPDTNQRVIVRSRPGRAEAVRYTATGRVAEKLSFTDKGWYQARIDGRNGKIISTQVGREEDANKNIWKEIPESHSP